MNRLTQSRRRLPRLLLSTTALGLALVAGPAWAADVVAPAAFVEPADVPVMFQYPYLEGRLRFDFKSEGVFESDDPGNEESFTEIEIEPSFDLHLTPWAKIHGEFVLEQVDDDGTPDQFFDFDYYGGYVDYLWVELELAGFQIIAGKFHPRFGIGWDETPGYWNDEFNGDYELENMIGGSVGYTFDFAEAGKHTLTGSAYFIDTTVLSESVFYNQGRTDILDGGAANTESLESFTLTLDGTDIAALPGIDYHLGLRHQAAGIGDFDDEFGAVAGLVKEIELDDDRSIKLVGEVAYFENFDASVNDAVYATLGAGYSFGKWTIGGGYTYRGLSNGPAGTNFDDHLLQVGFERDLGDDWSVSAGYAYAQVEDVDNHLLGLQLRKDFKFSTARPVGAPMSGNMFKP